MSRKNARSTNWPEATMRPLIGSFTPRWWSRAGQARRRSQIAAELDCHPKTVRIHLARFSAEGITGLGMREGAGRKPHLSERERSWILALVKQPPPRPGE